jgi:PIN domain nuclease of toxin-antitoxin system
MVVLDTHALLRAAGPSPTLGREAARAVEREAERNGLVISDVTLLEIATLESAGRIRVEGPFRPWLRDLIDEVGAAVRPLDVDVAARAHALAGALRDPFDRAIVGTALELGCPLVTADREIADAKVVKVVW